MSLRCAPLVSAWINAGRTVEGLIISYFETTWAEAEGMQIRLGIQAAVVGAAFLVTIVPLLILGDGVRGRGKTIRQA